MKHQPGICRFLYQMWVQFFSDEDPRVAHYLRQIRRWELERARAGLWVRDG